MHAASLAMAAATVVKRSCVKVTGSWSMHSSVSVTMNLHGTSKRLIILSRRSSVTDSKSAELIATLRPALLRRRGSSWGGSFV